MCLDVVLKCTTLRSTIPRCLIIKGDSLVHELLERFEDFSPQFQGEFIFFHHWCQPSWSHLTEFSGFSLLKHLIVQQRCSRLPVCLCFWDGLSTKDLWGTAVFFSGYGETHKLHFWWCAHHSSSDRVASTVRGLESVSSHGGLLSRRSPRSFSYFSLLQHRALTLP